MYVWILCKTDKILSFRDVDGETDEMECDMFRFPCEARRVFKMHFWFVFPVLTPHTAVEIPNQTLDMYIFIHI